MSVTALPYYSNGKRILFPGAENFGPGSFDRQSRMHVFQIHGGHVLPCKVVSMAVDSVSKKLDDSMKLTGITIRLFEN